MRRSERFRRIAVVVVVLGALVGLGRLVDLQTYLETVQEWIWGLGPWGPVVYGLVFVGATLLALPGTPLTILAALLFGTLWGFVTMVIATTISAVAAFFIARTLGKEQVRKKLVGSEAFDRLMALLDGNDWFVIPAIRLLPIFPYALNNYALGLTRIGFWRYLLLSELVMIPMNGLLVLGAGFLYSLLIKGEISWALMGITTAAGLLVVGLGLGARKLMARRA